MGPCIHNILGEGGKFSKLESNKLKIKNCVCFNLGGKAKLLGIFKAGSLKFIAAIKLCI